MQITIKAVLFTLLLAGQLNAQKTLIKGIIKNHDQERIEAALVYLKNTIRIVQTNDKGEYIIKDIEKGNYLLVVEYAGYFSLEIPFEISDKEEKTIDATLENVVNSFDEIQVTATRIDVHNLPQVNEYSIHASKKNEVVQLASLNANLAMNNARQILGKVPGLQIWESDGSGIQMSIGSRGLSPNRSWEFNTRLNGYDITPDPMGYPEAYYTPPMEVVEKIEIVRGAAALQYGPQFGGLLNFVLRKPDLSTKFTFESQNTVGSNGLLSTFNYIGGTEGKLSYTAYYQKRMGDGWREHSSFNTDHAHINLSYAVSNKLKIGGEVTYMQYKSQQAGGLTDSLYAIDARQSIRSRNWFSAPWLVPALTAEFIFNAKTKISLKTFATIGERSSIGITKAINIKDDGGQRQLDRDFYKNIGSELRLITEYDLLGKKHTLATGLRFFNGKTTRWQQGVGDNGEQFSTVLLSNNSYSKDLHFHNINYAAFVENIFRLNTKLLITAGIRYEHISSTAKGRIGYNGALPLTINDQIKTRDFVLFGAGMEYHTTAQQEFYTNVSQAYRPVLFSDLTPPATTDIIDQNLRDAKGYNFDFGYRGRIKNWLSFDVDYFYLNYNNRIGTIAQKIENAIIQYRTNLGKSTSKGFEGYIEIKPLAFLNNDKIGKLSLYASLAYIDASYQDFKVTSVSGGQITEKNLSGNQVENAPKKINRYGATYSRSNFSITYQISDVAETYADAANTIKANGSSTLGKIPAYKVVDLNATLKFSTHYNLKMGANNLLNTKYFTRRSGGYPGPGILPGDGSTFYVSFGLKF